MAKLTVVRDGGLVRAVMVRLAVASLIALIFRHLPPHPLPSGWAGWLSVTVALIGAVALLGLAVMAARAYASHDEDAKKPDAIPEPGPPTRPASEGVPNPRQPQPDARFVRIIIVVYESWIQD